MTTGINFDLVGLTHRMVMDFPFDSPGSIAIMCRCRKQAIGPTVQLLAGSYTHPPLTNQGQIWYT